MSATSSSDAIAIPLRTVVRFVAAVLAVVIVATIVGVIFTQRDRLFADEDRRVDHSTYQAVFLTSSQAYFGKLTIEGNDYLLRDVFYLNVPQQGGQSQLVKRGNELHGPIEPMIIPASQVLFWENLRTDSEVMAAIRAFKSGATPAPAPTSAPTTAPTPPPPSATGSARPSATR